MRQHPLHGRLARIVGNENVFDDPETLATYSKDFSPFPPIEPGIVVRPGSAQEISRIMKLANLEKNPVIPRGGGASITGFTRSGPRRSIVVDSRRMNSVLEIDEVNMFVRTQTGITCLALEEAIAAKGFYFHNVTIPAKYVTVGGFLSGVVGGGLPLDGPSVGNDMPYLVGLEVVLPTGKILRTGTRGSNINSQIDYLRGGGGPDVTGVFVADGGTMGFKTEATLQIFPEKPKTAEGRWVFPDFQKTVKMLYALMSLPATPFSRLSVREGEGEFGASYLVTAPNEVIATNYQALIDSTMENEGGERLRRELKLPQVPGIPQSALFTRDDRFVRANRALVAYVSPKKEFPKIYSGVTGLIRDRVAKEGLSERGVIVMPGFRPNARNGVYTTTSVFYDPSHPSGVNAVVRIMRDAYAKIVELGGSPEPHQGVSSTIIAKSWSPEYREFVKTLKATLDPKNVLNPGVWNLGQ